LSPVSRDVLTVHFLYVGLLSLTGIPGVIEYECYRKKLKLLATYDPNKLTKKLRDFKKQSKMIYDISKLVSAEHAACIGKQKRCKELIIESVSDGTQDYAKFHKNIKTQCRERKRQQCFEYRLHAYEMCESSDDDSLPSAAFSAAFSTRAWKQDIDVQCYESCIQKLLDDDIDSEDESIYLTKATNLLKRRKPSFK
jgi:hypothetical protein